MNKKKAILIVVVLLILFGKISYSYKSKYFSIELNNSKESSEELNFSEWIKKGREAGENKKMDIAKDSFEKAKEVAKTPEEKSLATFYLSSCVPEAEGILMLEEEMQNEVYIIDVPLYLMLLYSRNGRTYEEIEKVGLQGIDYILKSKSLSEDSKTLYLYKLYFDAAIYADENNEEEYFKLYTNSAMDNFDESFKKIDSQWHNLFHYKARVEFREGKYTEAEKFLAEIPLELLNQEQKSIVVKDKAYSKMGQGKFEEAKELLNESAKLGNSGAVSYLEKFDSYKEKIKKHIKQGIKFNPINP